MLMTQDKKIQLDGIELQNLPPTETLLYKTETRPPLIVMPVYQYKEYPQDYVVQGQKSFSITIEDKDFK